MQMIFILITVGFCGHTKFEILIGKLSHTVGDVLRIVNNFSRLDYRNYHYFVMRNGIDPTWEDSANRYGGVCSFKTEINPVTQPKELSLIPVWNYFLQMITGETLFENMADINGLSISPKNNWAIVKIWNRDKSNDIAELLPSSIKTKMAILSIKYKVNAPEY